MRVVLSGALECLLLTHHRAERSVGEKDDEEAEDLGDLVLIEGEELGDEDGDQKGALKPAIGGQSRAPPANESDDDQDGADA